MLKRYSMDEFLAWPSRILSGATQNGNYAVIETKDKPNAVIIDEDEWNILIGAFRLCVAHPEISNKP